MTMKSWDEKHAISVDPHITKYTNEQVELGRRKSAYCWQVAMHFLALRRAGVELSPAQIRFIEKHVDKETQKRIMKDLVTILDLDDEDKVANHDKKRKKKV
jgi:hypothetical protein